MSGVGYYISIEKVVLAMVPCIDGVNSVQYHLLGHHLLWRDLRKSAQKNKPVVSVHCQSAKVPSAKVPSARIEKASGISTLPRCQRCQVPVRSMQLLTQRRAYAMYFRRRRAGNNWWLSSLTVFRNLSSNLVVWESTTPPPPPPKPALF